MANNEEKIYLLKVGEEEPCSHCTWEDAFSRSEAVERMAKALYNNESRYVDLIPWVYLDSEIKRQFLERVEVALDALLGKEAENAK